MRSAGVPFFLLLLMASGARAQVSVDMRALDAVGGSRPATPAAPIHRRGVSRPPAPLARTRPVPATAAAQPPARPRASTPSASAVPIPALPAQLPAAPPASTMVPASAPSPTPLPPPVRLVFAEGATDLTPGDESAIRELARSIPAPAADSVNVVAYAAGKPNDPSTARRLSLSRGLAVRSVLLASGVPSAQIYVRALGSTPSDGPADRVELIVAPIGTVAR